ncbi:winged helix-turn-helix domain-containing protein [Terricaulis silvestris]|jgi:DNA-binding MarR family transcriptional regulator|uniref:Helix-turn-helix domain protein n=1 Tax=Terricaulis silvestris TaxID=2686094 RepID=A0A6I6MWZ4_9CAUL|nr:transcriptional regulator [Terricaulis silvestris]QGZ96914.1 Helix-turn-helix domain protein [Terricaulis silvestris]
MSKFDHTEIDDVIHGRLRLGVMAYLSTVSPAPFVELKGKVNATDGNLSTHLSKLEEAGYVRIEKKFEGKKPLTLVHLTKDGREAWIGYLSRIQALISAAE